MLWFTNAITTTQLRAGAFDPKNLTRQTHPVTPEQPVAEHLTLLVNGHIHTPGMSDATAMATLGEKVIWVGQDQAGLTLYPNAELLDLDGAFVAPGFVDAHVHATATGLHLTGLDLTRVHDGSELLAAVKATIRPGEILIAHGWDESNWRNPRVPSRAELDQVAGENPVYLSRVDVHSALVSSALVALAPDANSAEGWSESGPLTRDAHHHVRVAMRQSVTAAHRARAQRAFLRHTAENGIVSVHECAGPDISSEEDLSQLLALAADPHNPEVIGYWGELNAVETAKRLGATGLAGDVFVDGALGSRTAFLTMAYQDAPNSVGNQYLMATDIANHVAHCTEAGLQAGFHVIGDAAMRETIAGFELAEKQLGKRALIAAHHRLDHVEMIDREQAAAIAGWGISASVQPQFDAAWGGETGMYVRRLGHERARSLNPLALLAAEGVPLALGSDSPVTPMNPWETVRAAVHHRTEGSGLSARGAFAAHTRGGYRAAGSQDPAAGTLAPGAPAHYAIWSASRLEVASSDSRVRRWSTDPRSGTPPLPALEPGASLPRCLRTVRAGQVIHDELTTASSR
jgi:hypothetical protein